jgi:phosphonate transport system substrate-binding protein
MKPSSASSRSALKSTTLRVCTAAIVVLFLCQAASLAVAGPSLKFGVVPQFEARRIQTIWQPVLNTLEKQSGLHFELVGSPDIPGFEKQFLAGDFDFAYMNPYHLLKAHQSKGYIPLTRDVGRMLFGIVVVRKDSPVQDVKDLNGKEVAFPAPNALGAALLPRTAFGEIYKINIRPQYVRSHSSVYLNVVTGQTVAGGGVQKTLQQQPTNIRDALKVIYQTPQIAPHPIAVHPRVDKVTQNKVREAFLQLGNTPEGRELLARIPIKQIGRATMEDYEPLKQMGLDKYYVQ